MIPITLGPGKSEKTGVRAGGGNARAEVSPP